GIPHRSSSSARCNVVPPSGLVHNRANRVNDRLRLADGDDVARLLGDDLAPLLRQPDVVTLLLSPHCICLPPGRPDHHGNAQLATSGPDLRRTLPQVDALVRRRLIRRGTEAGRPSETTYGRRQGVGRRAERYAEEAKHPNRGEKGYKRSDGGN